MRNFVRDMKVTHLLDIVNAIYTNKGKMEKIGCLMEILEDGMYGDYELTESLTDVGRDGEVRHIVDMSEDGYNELFGLFEYLEQNQIKMDNAVKMRKVEKLKKLGNLGVM